VRGGYVEVTASVSNFVPKPHTPYQWNGMQTREYLQWAGRYMRNRCRIRSVRLKQHSIECSLLEGVLSRGDRRVAVALEEAWRRGCRLDGWSECFRPELWWQTFADLGIDPAWYAQRPRPMTELLPWDHIQVKKGRAYLEKEQVRSQTQLAVMATAS
ncbi:MAG: B12-binding domain-containing radical SAM protein, partial [Gemmataceae bacterium]|nr:B12-binding domain-containing radical SAM protein [Gemmataceae bacterium]